MKKIWIFLTLAFLIPHAAEAQQGPSVLAAAATSSAPGSTPITCLLDANCHGSWAPGSSDAGTDEGIYIQFDTPIDLDYVEVGVEPDSMADDKYTNNFRLYLNGKTRNTKGAFGANVDGTTKTFIFGVKNPASPNLAPVGEKVKSVFLKIDAGEHWKAGDIKIKSLRFKKGTSVIALLLPKLLPAQVTATSILEPVTAYDPANLFDSKYDFAWSTDGKKTTGKGESFTLTLQNPQSLAGIMVWNGYQRSDEHFKSNGRVSELQVQADNQPPQTLKLADAMGQQKIFFSPPLLNAGKLTFTIQNIIPGATYKDVLLSELRLIGVTGELIAPVTNLPKVAVPATFQGMVNRSFASILHQPITGKVEDSMGPDNNFANSCDNSRIRLRDNGTFVIYKDFNYGKTDSAQKPTNIDANVMEGNWEPKGDAIRIFGRKYVTALQQSEYLQEQKNASPQVQIFQSEVTIKPYKALTPAEKQSLFAFLWSKKKGPVNKAQKLGWVVGSNKWNGTDQYKKTWIEGTSYDDVVKKLDPLLQELNPYYLSSSVLTDLLLPSDDVEACYSS